MFIEEDPYNPRTIGGWIRAFGVARAIEAELGDQAAIDADMEQLKQAEAEQAKEFWAQMEADGFPVATPAVGAEPEVEPEAEAEAEP